MRSCVFINTKNEHVHGEYKIVKKSQHDCCRQIVACKLFGCEFIVMLELYILYELTILVCDSCCQSFLEKPDGYKSKRKGLSG